jgi:hypothetical protein
MTKNKCKNKNIIKKEKSCKSLSNLNLKTAKFKTKKYNNSSNNVIILTGNYINVDTKTKLAPKKLRFEAINKNFLNPKKSKNKTPLFVSESDEESQNEDSQGLNELPFSKALREDKRSIFQLFKSILFEKLELINIFISNPRIRIICIGEYILSLLFDFFFNALLYSDDVVSQKYHNNGELDTTVSLMISLLSNIISSIVCNIIEYSKGVEERLEQILEIRREYKYLYALNQLLKFLKLKMFLFILNEIILVAACFYYIVIFCIVYSKSQMSLLINYLYSLLEGLIKSLIVTATIVICRQLGLIFKSSYIYNTSKYINENF